MFLVITETPTDGGCGESENLPLHCLCWTASEVSAVSPVLTLLLSRADRPRRLKKGFLYPLGDECKLLPPENLGGVSQYLLALLDTNFLLLHEVPGDLCVDLRKVPFCSTFFVESFLVSNDCLLALCWHRSKYLEFAWALSVEQLSLLRILEDLSTKQALPMISEIKI